MAHFAQLHTDDIVRQVIVVNNSDILDANGVESEALGIAFCKSLYGADSIWVQTSYSASFRKNYAGPGYRYDRERDAFIPPKPFLTWVLDEATCRWVPPVALPADANTGEPPKRYTWDEVTTSWVEVTFA